MSEALIDRDSLCGGCGYNLRGLATPGRCPECGKDYGPQELILWGAESKWSQLSRLAKILKVTWACFMAAVFAWTIWDAVRGNIGSYAALGMWAFVVANFLLYRGKRLQVRISAKGCGIKAGYGSVKIRPWTPYDEIDLRRVRANCYHFTIRRGIGTAVDTRIELPDEQVEAIRTQISAWSRRHAGLEK